MQAPGGLIYAGPDLNAQNREIARQLGVMAELHINDVRRYNAYSTAAKNIARWNKPILSGKQSQAEIPGVGASIAAKIDEILASGQINQLTNLPAEDKQRLDIERLFRTIKGVGKVKAGALYDQGYRTLQDLVKEYPQMTPAQQLGFYHYNDLSQRVPRAEIDMVDKYLHAMLDPLGVKFEIAGSYRRGGQNSGDIDVLVENPSNDANPADVANLTPVFMQKVIEPLIRSGFIIGTIAYGKKSKYAGLIRAGNDETGKPRPVRQFDMRFIKPDSWWHGLLHFTGSDHFNKEMRLRAISMGLSLSEYALVDRDGRRYPYDQPPKSERDIFAALKVAFLEPHQRTETVQLQYLDAQPVQAINPMTVVSGQWSRPQPTLLIYIANNIGQYIRNPAMIAGFDLDHTLINNRSGQTFSRGLEDVVLMPRRLEVMQDFIRRGYTVVIFTNQSSRSEKEMMSKFNRVDHALKLLNLPVIAMIATAKDEYRKPGTGMFQQLLTLIPNVDMQQSFYVGDAAARQNDHSADDIDFARNNKLAFRVPEEVFGN